MPFPRQQRDQRWRAFSRHQHQHIVVRQPRGFGVQTPRVGGGVAEQHLPSAQQAPHAALGQRPGTRMQRFQAKMSGIDPQDTWHLSADAVHRIG